MTHILIVDDEANMRQILAAILTEQGYQIHEAGGVGEALAAVAAHSLDLVITDQRMPDGDGLSLLHACRDSDPTLPVIVLTAYATIDLAVEAMRAGAFDFITKPFTPDSVLPPVARAIEHADLVRENLRLRREVQRLGAGDQLVGTGRAMTGVRQLIARVAPTHATALITGETGVGKELVARAIHHQSPRHDKPFVAVNCAALTESLLESELFGHEKGAFTGADRPRQGLFEAAHRGTLFLDEAGEMPLSLQAKLLRVLVDGRVTRVGSTQPREVDVRIIVATHRDLAARVREGHFREDLYYRLAVVPIAVPPLRERPEDLPMLAEYFLHRSIRDLNLPMRRLSRAAISRLQGYAFPGNVRELRNLIERACILATGVEIKPDAFPLPGEPGPTSDSVSGSRSVSDVTSIYELWLRAQPQEIELRATLEQIERDFLLRALRTANGVQAEAGRQLGISRSDMAYKLKKYRIDPGAM